MAENVDFNFIKEQEGFKTTGYVPVDKDGKVLGSSGVTVASGFDLGQRGINDLQGLPKELVKKLSPFVGLQGTNALADAGKLVLTDEEALIVNKFAKKQELGRLSKKWKAETGTDFSTLPIEQATAIASVAFQYGDLETKTPNFWKQVTTDDWDGAKKNLANFGDKYDSRRKRELAYLNQEKKVGSPYGAPKVAAAPAVSPNFNVAGGYNPNKVDQGIPAALPQDVVNQGKKVGSPYEPQMRVAENTTFGAPKPREEVIRETVTEEGPGFYDRFTSGIKELLPFNEGGPVEEQTTTTETIDVLPSDNYYRNYMMQEAARRSMMQGNEEERMADYNYARAAARGVADDISSFEPDGSYALPQMQAAQRIMGGYTEGGRVSSPQGLASLGRGGDSTLVHMQPREVAGLQQLAQSNGTSLTRNPMTGYPEAFSLGGMFKAALPIAAGYFAPGSQFLTGAGGLGMTAGNAALAAGALTGAGVAAATGDDPILGAVTGGLGGMSGGRLNTAFGGAGVPEALGGSTVNPALVNTTPTAAAGSFNPALDSTLSAGVGGGAPLTQGSVLDPNINRGASLEQKFRTNLGKNVPFGNEIIEGNQIVQPMKFEPAGNMELARTFGAPIASMGLGGLEESDFMVKPDFNDPRDKYDPRSTLDLSRDTGVSEAMSRDTGLRLLAKGGYINGPGDGMSDDIPATINGDEPAALADGEFVIPADVVSHLGNGSSAAGSKQLHAMMERIRQARTGRKSQGKEIKPGKYMPR